MTLVWEDSVDVVGDSKSESVGESLSWDGMVAVDGGSLVMVDVGREESDLGRRSADNLLRARLVPCSALESGVDAEREFELD